MAKRIACLGDSSDHSGTLTTTNQDNKAKVKGISICVDQCEHQCGNPLHGTTKVTAITTKSKINGKLIITEDATAGCGAKITPIDRGVYVE